jgi:uncharacterized protein YcaQ
MGMKLSLEMARALMLAAQGLRERPHRPATKEDALAAIRRMGLLQIDTISVVARSPYLVLWSRLGTYEPRWLDALLAGGALFEYWSHAVCFLPIEDYGLYRWRMREHAAGDSYLARWRAENPAAVERVLGHIHANGAVRSADFERRDGKSGGWWDWKPEKVALEYLFHSGELMIARREGFQRVYDLRERVLPDWDDAQTRTREESGCEMALRAVKALGIARARWLYQYFPHHLHASVPKRSMSALLEGFAREGLLIPVAVEGWKECAYVHRDNRELAEQAADGALRSAVTTLLSPFDPLVSDRARAKELFGFEYRIEVYTPAPKRQYGYFTLPILHRGQLVGRLDPKAHRKEGLFEVRALHLEPDTPLTEELVTELAGALRACARWHGTPQVAVRQSDPPEFARLVQASLDDGAAAE